MKTNRSVSLACALLAGGLVILGCSKSDHTPPKGVAGVTPEGKMEMQFKWNIGKRYVMRMEVIADADLKMPNQPKPMKQLTSMAQDYTISVLKELPDGGRELELEFTGASMESKLGNQVVVSFDTAETLAPDTGNPLASGFRKTVGGRLKYIMNSEGRVDRIEGANELIAHAMEGTQPIVQSSLGSMYNEGYFKQLCDVGRMAPGRNVKPGSTWPMNFEEELGSLGTLIVTSTLKFENWEQHGDRKCARIEFTGEIATRPPEGAGKTPNAMAIEVEKGRATGTAWFDPALGMIVESVSDQDMTMKITTMGQTINSQARQKVIFKLLEVVDVPK